jgi:rhamnulokinase
MSSFGQGRSAIAVDLGASSGRVVKVTIENNLVLREVARFETPWSFTDGYERWDLAAITKHVLAAIDKAEHFQSIGIDTWGVDFGLIDETGQPIADPIRYRDPSHRTGFEELNRRMPALSQFELTGVQPMPFNSSAQLLARTLRNDEELASARAIAFMPDLVARAIGASHGGTDITHASTTQLLGLDGDWCPGMIEATGVSPSILPKLVQIGDTIGELRGRPFIQVCSHDTASAVLAAPLDKESAYISSGTWSLVGIETQNPITTEAARLDGFTNERGYGSTYRFLKNIAGLWLIQRCLSEGESATSAALKAQSAEAFGAKLDVNHAALINPEDMRSAIRAIADKPIESEAALYRAILENLARSYAEAIERLEMHAGQPIKVIRVVGGGSKNAMLNQMTADATGRLVIAGPAEATIIGSALVQYQATGAIRDASIEGRQLVRSAFGFDSFEPKETALWQEWMSR